MKILTKKAEQKLYSEISEGCKKGHEADLKIAALKLRNSFDEQMLSLTDKLTASEARCAALQQKLTGRA